MKLEKDGIVKEIKGESLIADYIRAGFKEVKEEPKKAEKEDK